MSSMLGHNRGENKPLHSGIHTCDRVNFNIEWPSCGLATPPKKTKIGSKTQLPNPKTKL
jgi:hypothetical protein